MPGHLVKTSILFLAVFILVLHQAPIITSGAQSQPQAGYADKLHVYLQSQMEIYKIPGMAIAIVRNGEIEYLKGLGIANSRGEPVTPETPFLLASVSKSITAVGVMQLVESGLLNLDDPVQKYLPWFDVAGGEGHAITIAHLLYQTSGLSESGGLKSNLFPDGPEALEAGVRALANEKLVFRPGDGWEYSNLNYNVLGLLIQVVSGQLYEDYITEHIFHPLGMKNSSASISAARAGGATNGYYPFFGIPVVYDRFMPYSRATLPSAGLWSSASDMARYLVAHLNGGQYEDISLLSPESVEVLHHPSYMFHDQQGYAMGWTNNQGFMSEEQLEKQETELKNHDALTVLFHEGDWAGFKSMAFMIPEVEYGVVMLMNSNNPTVQSVFRFFAWDVTLVATGGDAQYFPPAETFLVRYSRWIFAGITFLLLAGLVWSLRILYKIRKGIYTIGFNDKGIILQVIIPVSLIIALNGFFFIKVLPDANTSLPFLIRFAPDLGIIIYLILLLSIGWGAACALLVRNAWRRRPQQPVGAQKRTGEPS